LSEGVLADKLATVNAGWKNVKRQQEAFLLTRQERIAAERTFPAHWTVQRIRSHPKGYSPDGTPTATPTNRQATKLLETSSEAARKDIESKTIKEVTFANGAMQEPG
jgi:hypothetical protein